MNLIDELNALGRSADSSGGPAIALAAVDVACTATGLLLGDAHDMPLLGCSAAVVSLDAARVELSQLADPDEGLTPTPLVRDDPETPSAAARDVIALLVALRPVLLQIVSEATDARSALICSRAVRHLNAAIRSLTEDQG